MARDFSDPVADDRTVDFSARLRRLYETDIGRRREFALRNIIVISVSSAVGLVIDSWVPFIWLAVYLSVIAAHARLLIAKKDSVFATAADWHLSVAITTAACVIYAALPLYLWTMPDMALNFVAACGIFGMAMLNLTRHTFDRTLARIDMAVVSGSILIMGGVAAWHLGANAHSGLVVAGTLACAVYYGFAHHDGLVLRTRLLEKERREAQADKMQAVGQLTTGIAHDFNNILTVVIGNIELARLSTEPGEIDQSLAEAHDAAERAGSLVSQLLAFSRRAQLRPVPIEPHVFFETFARTMERLLPASITLRHHVSPGMPCFECDRTLLETALLNLVINARDAMGGRGSLAILVAEAELPTGRQLPNNAMAPGRFARIQVFDTGPGIPPDLLGRVTEPFFTTKPIGKGSGLGLAMVKGFSEQSGGGLEIASSPRGTEMVLYLPLASPVATRAARETVTGQVAHPAPP